MNSIALIVLTRNPGSQFELWLESLEAQSIIPSLLLAMDTMSDDGTRIHLNKFGFKICDVAPKDFNHAGTRRLAANMVFDYMPDVQHFIYMTQDALLAETTSIEFLVKSVAKNNVGASFGRQLPHKNASFAARYSRHKNYKDNSRILRLADRYEYGLRTCYLSNSFAIYNANLFREGILFPEKLIFGEDMYVAAQALLRGYSISYCAEASVYHSHNYNWKEEFQRCFDIGVYHTEESWLLDEFGRAEGEGLDYFKNEIKSAYSESLRVLTKVLFVTVVKFLAYKLGRNFKYLPTNIKKAFSMSKNYWS